jgi:hypothetical protein
VILYRKGGPLRVRRSAAPEPPYWCATSVAPYGAKRATPVAIDYLTLRATGVGDRLEVSVCDDARDELERSRTFTGPVLIEAAETAERIFRRGQAALELCEEQRLASIHLISTRGELPARAYDDSVVVIAAWPLELSRLEEMFGDAQQRGLRWGVAVPVLYPVTTELAPLTALADLAQSHGATFLTAMSVELEPTAKQALAQSLQLEADDDRYAMLFHGSTEAMHLGTERHLAALAHERALSDFLVPPRWEERSNWNAAVLLTRASSPSSTNRSPASPNRPASPSSAVSTTRARKRSRHGCAMVLPRSASSWTSSGGCDGGRLRGSEAQRLRERGRIAFEPVSLCASEPTSGARPESSSRSRRARKSRLPRKGTADRARR